MTPEVGKVYFRKSETGKAVVVRVTALDEWVEYAVLHGPSQLLRKQTGRCKAKNFSTWEPCEESADYAHLDRCRRFATFLVLDTQGEPLLRCSEKRAQFYLRKDYAKTVSEGVLQFTDDQTERQLRESHVQGFSEFFLAVKNDRCVVCGVGDNLTRHHVVPRRHKEKLPQAGRRCLSNVLFVCNACHQRYEQTTEPNPEYAGDWREYARRWKQHFLDTLAPQHMPEGWDIISTKRFEPEFDALSERPSSS